VAVSSVALVSANARAAAGLAAASGAVMLKGAWTVMASAQEAKEALKARLEVVRKSIPDRLPKSQKMPEPVANPAADSISVTICENYFSNWS